ncbi:MAG TPA: superoxide dismutase family protein [Blastocatellia bacterium]|jgi:Cu-Zn family superoxide dismutase
MKQLARLSVVCLLFLGLTLCVAGRANTAPRIIKARADIQGAPGSGISGEAILIQTDDDGILPTVKVLIIVRGLAPHTTHGLHIHEVGSCADTTVPFGGAGGHFDPGPFGQSNPDTNHPYHMGDLTNLEANGFGVAILQYTTSRITLSPSPVSVFDANGSAVIVHGNPDQGITGAAGSGVSGGPRIACGVIELID